MLIARQVDAVLISAPPVGMLNFTQNSPSPLSRPFPLLPTCPSLLFACSISSPNGNIGVDGMISVLAHEISEAATDPTNNGGWFSHSGEENADLCVWKFGDTQSGTDGNGGSFDWNLNGVDGSRFLVQLNMDPDSQTCVLQRAWWGGGGAPPPEDNGGGGGAPPPEDNGGGGGGPPPEDNGGGGWAPSPQENGGGGLAPSPEDNGGRGWAPSPEDNGGEGGARPPEDYGGGGGGWAPSSDENC